MTWLTWRQHRAEALTLGLLVAVIGLVLIGLGIPMHDLFPLGASHCATPPLDMACRTGVVQLQQISSLSTPMLTLFNLVPFVIGAFLGAPLLARELESGTWQLAWTQAIPRMRWLAVKLSALGTLTILLTAAFTALSSWYREPLNLFGRFEINGFDVSGAVPVAYGLFAFATAAAAGTILRRSLPALAVTLAVFVAVRVIVASAMRPAFRTPVAVFNEVTPGGNDLPMLTGPQDWTLGEGLASADGHHLGLSASSQLDHAAREAGIDLTTYLHDHGIHQWASYHPAERFWTFQLTEAAIFTSLAAALLILVIWRVKRRPF